MHVLSDREERAMSTTTKPADLLRIADEQATLHTLA
jgi:hypothetical protein